MNHDCTTADALLPQPVIVMAKAPLPGFCKTRLQPALDIEGSTQLAYRLLQGTLRRVLTARPQLLALCCAPDCQHELFRAAANHDNVRLFQQVDGDLGTRMQCAFATVLPHPAGALMIGTDSPTLDTAVLRDASAALQQHDVVIVPTFDGGYALIGLRHLQPTLFEDIAWSTSQVMQQTRTHIKKLGLRLAELPALADIDEPSDLRHLPEGWLPIRRRL